MSNNEHVVVELGKHVDGEYCPRGEHEDQESSAASHDNADMRRMGRSQQLNRNFRSVSILGLTCVAMGTWLNIVLSLTSSPWGSNSGLSLINGGRAGTVWIYFGSALSTIAVTASLAEMASMAPSSGGQYHWVSELASPSVQKPLSYVSGWLCALAWQALIAGTAYTGGEMILICASVMNPSYVPTAWHGTLITVGVALFSVLFNTFGARQLPLFEAGIMLFDILGFFAVLLPLWILAPKVSAAEVFQQAENFGGWPTLGTGVIVGQIAALGVFVGVDSAAHMAEEVKDASIVVPRMMMATVAFNTITGFVAIITYCFCVLDLEEQVVNSTAVFPFIDVFASAVNSRGGAVAMTVPFIVLTISCCINAVAAGSRQAWAFAKDDGLPFSKWFAKLTTIQRTPLPINTLMISVVIVLFPALLNLAGPAAFNSILGLLNGAAYATYSLSIACVLWRRLFGEPLPHARWSLGRWGVPINAYSVLYTMYTVVISMFPTFADVSAPTMNWGVAMFGGIGVISLVYYIVRGRFVYEGPVVYVVKT